MNTILITLTGSSLPAGPADPWQSLADALGYAFEERSRIKHAIYNDIYIYIYIYIHVYTHTSSNTYKHTYTYKHTNNKIISIRI